MKSFAAFIVVFTLLFSWNAFAYEKDALSWGADVKKEEKEALLRLFNVKNSPDEVVVTKEEEKKYASGIVSDARLGSKAVTCAYVSGLSTDEGVKVNISNLTYITQEMVTLCAITAGMKDVSIYAASPYNVSGSASLVPVFKAYEKITDSSLTEASKAAACMELAVLMDIGQEIGMQKSLRLINEIEKKVIKSSSIKPDQINRIVSEQEKKFNVNLDSVYKGKLVDLMGKIKDLGLDAEVVAKQQKNISVVVDDLSKSAIDKNIFEAGFDYFMGFLKKISQLFSTNNSEV